MHNLSRFLTDYEKFKKDHRWDGLKGYLTNAKLDSTTIISNYQQLWQIEKAFRISKTDLKIWPIYHRLQNRIEAHLCISGLTQLGCEVKQRMIQYRVQQIVFYGYLVKYSLNLVPARSRLHTVDF